MKLPAYEPELVLIDLPWPTKELSQNHRIRWETAEATKEARALAKLRASQLGLPCWPQAKLEFSFYPPNAIRRDIQNMPGMVKAYIDGLADAMGCDDHAFRPHFPSTFCEQIERGGVLVEITP